MGAKTNISWTTSTWNPIRARNLKTGQVGWHCVHMSEGCRNCYAETFNIRLGTRLPYKPGHEKDIEIFLDEQMVTQPSRWRAPRLIFVCSMTDLFATFVKHDWQLRMAAEMYDDRRHTYQILTKRPDAMVSFMRKTHSKPYPHMWLGFSAEDQESFDERWAIMRDLARDGWMVWVSLEPLIGRVVLPPDALEMLSWVVVGGESGANARFCHPVWARALRDQCAAAGIAFHFKQWGTWSPERPQDFIATERNMICVFPNGDRYDPSKPDQWTHPLLATLYRHAKKETAGHRLDGAEHLAFPARAA